MKTDFKINKTLQKTKRRAAKTKPMSNIIRARVIKSASNRFVLDTPNGLISCSARKTVKQKSDIVAGDFVLVSKEADGFVLTEVLPRKNSLIRPLVANIDLVIAVAAATPKPDYFLIDKLIINANRQDIGVVLCLNKSDLSRELFAELTAQYQFVVEGIAVTSAAHSDTKELLCLLNGKLSCLAGQSAVGKSSLINALTGHNAQKTAAVSEKNERGKNTTTRAEIIKLSADTYIIDTPGFSMLDMHGIARGELDLYYPEYMQYAPQCKFHRCTHTVEPDCRVRTAAQAGELNAARYRRYCVMHDALKAKKEY